MCYPESDVPFSADEPQLLSTCVNEGIPALTHLKNGCNCGTIFEEMQQMSLVVCGPHPLRALRGKVPLIDDARREPGVLCLLLADGT